MILINDVKLNKNGYFQLNPLYKAHKRKQDTAYSPKVHTPNMAPVISGMCSPLVLLRFISNICSFLIHVLQNEYNIINIVEDSYHVTSIIFEYY